MVLKVNIPGLVGALLALISTFLPWWTMNLIMEDAPQTWVLYLYQTSFSTGGSGISGHYQHAFTGEWYAYVAMGLIAVGAVFMIVGSFARFRRILHLGVITVASAVLLFTVGLVFYGYSPFASVSGDGTAYSTYLDYGYWLAVASFAIPIIAGLFKRGESEPAPVQTLPS